MAVVPFESGSGSPELRVVGDLVADGVIARLMRSDSLRVLSRFSTAALRTSDRDGADLNGLLGANYVLRGTFAALADRVLIAFELSDARTAEVLAVGRHTGSMADLFETESELCGLIAEATLSKIVDEQLRAALTRPLPTLASYSLYLAGVTGLHRSVPREHQLGEAALNHLLDRHPRSADPGIWLAQWLAIRVSRGLSTDPKGDFQRAKQLLSVAMNSEPENPFGLTVQGLVESYFHRNFTGAEKLYQRAAELNPNENLAWLYRATLMAWTDRPDEGVAAAEKALHLTPLHPMRYYIESLAGVPFLVAGQYDRAIELFKSSLRANRMHTASHRGLVAAFSLAGRATEASACVTEMLAIEPGITGDGFLARYPGRDGKFAKLFQQALVDAGVPR